MLSEILLVLLILAVAALMVLDVVRTRNESSRGQARKAPGVDRIAAAAGPRDAGARASAAKPAGGVTMLPAPAAKPAGGVSTLPAPAAKPAGGVTTLPAPAAGLPPRLPAPPAGLPPRPAGSAPAADGHRDAGTWPTASDPALRDKLSAILVSLSHRNQSLAERQLRLIENLEGGERDGQRLANLLKVNRIAMRMHRNAQNLLVLAGREQSASWHQPVTLAQLINAALAEVEGSERISCDVQSDLAVRGPAVNDLVHLLVELTENATSFSAADMPVHVTGRILTSGGALVDITDRGIGMTAETMAYVNHQLENPLAIGLDLPRGLGLLVVARLAAQHGIRVRLNQAESGGLAALVWLPDEILIHHVAATDPGAAVAQQRGPAAVRSAGRTTQGAPGSSPDLARSARSPQPAAYAEPPAAVLLAVSAPPDLPGQDIGVAVPYADSPTAARGLPIFEEVESHWSRSGREASGSADLPAAGPAAGLVAAADPAASVLPRRHPAAAQGHRAVPGAPPPAPNRPAAPLQGQPEAAGEAEPGGADKS